MTDKELTEEEMDELVEKLDRLMEKYVLPVERKWIEIENPIYTKVKEMRKNDKQGEV